MKTSIIQSTKKPGQMPQKQHSPLIKSWISDQTGFLEFNTPHAKNAISEEMWRAIPKIINRFEADKDIRVIVIRGSGQDCFSAGADIKEFSTKRADPQSAQNYETLNTNAFEAIAATTKPVIAMIYGICMGGGLAIALACDLRIAAENAIFALPPAKLGLAYPTKGLEQLLSVVSLPIAKEMLFTAKRLNALEASRTGLVNQIASIDTLNDTIVDLCATIAANAPLTISASKAALDELHRPGCKPDLKRLEKLATKCFNSADYQEGQKAFMEKRKPEFKGN